MSREKSISQHFLEKKQKGEKLCLLTCYDYSFAKALDKAGLDAVLVGDSLANVVLGYAFTKEVGIEEMLKHTQAVRKAMERTFVIADMPFSAYQIDREKGVENALRFIEESQADCVKLEWFENFPYTAENIIKKGIPVMGHIGLTPQTADKLGGFKVQARQSFEAERVFQQAKLCQEIGCFSLVLECVPYKVSEIIASKLKIPVIGIGAGKGCDGQILVLYDLLGLTFGKVPKFVRKYADMASLINSAAQSFIEDVIAGRFPKEEESFSINQEEFNKFKEAVG